MRRLNESVVLSCDTEKYWQLFWDEAAMRKLYLEGLGFRAFTVLEKTETERRLKIQPKMNLPGAVEKLLGPTFAYEEIGTLDRTRNEWKWRMKSPLGDKLQSHGVVRLERAGEGSVKRVDEVTIEANIFGLSTVIETAAEKELRAAWPKEFDWWRAQLT